MMDKVPRNIASVSLSHGLFSRFDLLTVENWTDMLPQNVGKELPICAV